MIICVHIFCTEVMTVKRFWLTMKIHFLLYLHEKASLLSKYLVSTVYPEILSVIKLAICPKSGRN